MYDLHHGEPFGLQNRTAKPGRLLPPTPSKDSGAKIAALLIAIFLSATTTVAAVTSLRHAKLEAGFAAQSLPHAMNMPGGVGFEDALY